MRVLYAAVAAGVTVQRPSARSGALLVYPLAVPERKYSACRYPRLARSMVVDWRKAPPGLVIGPSTVGFGTAADATDAMAMARSMSRTRANLMSPTLPRGVRIE